MTLLLDPDIRDWVVLPLFIVMVVTGLLRHSVGQWMQGPKKKTPVVFMRTQNTLKQTMRVRSFSHHYMTTFAWHARRQHVVQYLQQQADWVEEYNAKIKAEKEEKEGEGGDASSGAAADDDDPMTAMMNNPMSMMQGNMVFMVQNMVMMQGIQHFFSGFILLKIPFGLTAGFKNMFQRGLASLPDLEPSYVSSISWYFLVMYGLRSFFRLAIGDPSLELRQQEQLLASFGLQAAPPPGKKQDADTMAKQLRQEAENLEVQVIGPNQRSELDSVERRLLGKRYPKKVFAKVASSDSDFILGGGGGGSGGTSSKSKSKRKTQ